MNTVTTSEPMVVRKLVSLDTETQDMLKKLSREYGLSASATLRFLVRREYSEQKRGWEPEPKSKKK